MANAGGADAPRVLHVIDSLGLGGAQFVLKSFLESRPAGDPVGVYSLRQTANPVAIAHAGVEIAPSPSRFSLAPLFQLRRMVATQRIDVLHCHLFRAQVFGFLLKCFLCPRIELVFHEHGRVDGREGESSLEAHAFRAFLRGAAPRVSRFICISDATRDSLNAIVGELAERAVVIHNPIPVAKPVDHHEREAARRQWDVPDGAFTVGFAARLVERKGWRDFLAAIKELAAATPTWYLVAGDGKDREEVARCVRALGLQSKGRLLGYVADMSRFYAALDCFAAPAHWESHGLTHLEAQSYGVPVVVSAVPGLGGTVHAEQDALLCAPRDPSGLARQLLRVARDVELRRRLAHAGRLNAAEYTVDAFAAALARVYAALACAHHSASSAACDRGHDASTSKQSPS